MNIDTWQILGSLAASAFTLGFIDQLRITLKTKNVDGLSIIQWGVFFLASAVFVGYYAHLEQWMMFSISIFGTICCLSVLLLIYKFRAVTD